MGHKPKKSVADAVRQTASENAIAHLYALELYGTEPSLSIKNRGQY